MSSMGFRNLQMTVNGFVVEKGCNRTQSAGRDDAIQPRSSHQPLPCGKFGNDRLLAEIAKGIANVIRLDLGAHLGKEPTGVLHELPMNSARSPQTILTAHVAWEALAARKRYRRPAISRP